MLPLLLALLCSTAGARERAAAPEPGYWTDGRYCARSSAVPSAAGQLLLTQMSDGAEVLRALWMRGQVLECWLSGDPAAVRPFASLCHLRAASAGGLGRRWAEGRAGCRRFLRRRGAATLPRGDAAAPRVPRSAGSGGATLHRSKRGFTYPGTLWCGAGNNADSYDHLGKFSETDKCCREHDHCDHVIDPLSYAYGHRNLRLHTLSHCDCDNKLKQCLIRVNDSSSRVVGQAFFNVLQVPCFEFAYKEQCVERYWYGWCKRYDHMHVAVPKQSLLFNYGGDLVDELLVTPEFDSNSPTTFSWLNTPSFTPTPEATSQRTTFGQVLHAAEDLVKVMATVTQSSANGSMSGTAGNSVSEKTGISLDKVKERKKKRRKGKRRKGKRKKKNREGKRRSKGSKATNVLQVQNKDYFTELEKAGKSNKLGHQLFDNSLDSMIKRDVFNDMANESHSVQSYTQLHKMSTVSMAKPNQRFQHYRIEDLPPLLVTQSPVMGFYRENLTAKLWPKAVDGHQSFGEGAFTSAPRKTSPISHPVKKEPSFLTMMTPGQYREETSTAASVHAVSEEMTTNAKLKASRLVPSLESIHKKQRRKKCRKRKNRKLQQKSRLTIPTAPHTIVHGELEK
ncbi:uncharacterized protein proca1 [Narcine bancroftii]|uniref:uncharacterized protein proca1 n=1 Tax=Narcine bancroftii TaxID=1343680 RepID=UPI0038320B4D